MELFEYYLRYMTELLEGKRPAPAGITLTAEDEEEAFAQAYLCLGLSERDEITQKTVEKSEEGFLVTIKYTVVQTWNM